MEKVEITSMSSRGQVVIPQDIRKQLKLEAGEKFLVLGIDDSVLLKKIRKQSFEEITRPFKKIAKKAGLKEKDVPDIIHRFRKLKR